jgi:hypothetical protein
LIPVIKGKIKSNDDGSTTIKLFARLNYQVLSFEIFIILILIISDWVNGAPYVPYNGSLIFIGFMYFSTLMQYKLFYGHNRNYLDKLLETVKGNNGD